MSVYQGLWRKEILMMRGFHILMSIAGVVLVGTVLLNQDGHSGVETALELSALSFVLMPATVLFSLNMEKHQLSLFLFVKRNLPKQVLIKFFHGWILFTIYFLFIAVLTLVFYLIGQVGDTIPDILQGLATAYIYLFFISVMGTVAVFLAWVLYQLLRKRFNFFLSLILIYFFFVALVSLVQVVLRQISWMDSWSMVPVRLNKSLSMFWVNDQISMIAVIIFLIILVFFYQLSLFLLKYKVEV
ncbi:hypothetical protein [Gracilibacillus alcaliphilus]|uniref:hypothetical protein n=1 Tax=Gracilibacillus alcaliphilus TaxID=1401441 RepID=UPI001956BD59|nr:hypothetical protein [Gracilibacillus alcaliphilus]MBM7675845.1 magnesium-transporting ATPase (P-type) [Gracilibacillus alcaliphilus]